MATLKASPDGGHDVVFGLYRCRDATCMSDLQSGTEIVTIAAGAPEAADSTEGSSGPLCRAARDPLGTPDLQGFFWGSRIAEISIKGNTWTEYLDKDGVTILVNSSGREVLGRYWIGNDQICFSYGTGETWGCKTIARCVSGEADWVIADLEKQQTSIITELEKYGAWGFHASRRSELERLQPLPTSTEPPPSVNNSPDRSFTSLPATIAQDALELERLLSNGDATVRVNVASCQMTVIVTTPLVEQEVSAGGWSDWMSSTSTHNSQKRVGEQIETVAIDLERMDLTELDLSVEGAVIIVAEPGGEFVKTTQTRRTDGAGQSQVQEWVHGSLFRTRTSQDRNAALNLAARLSRACRGEALAEMNQEDGGVGVTQSAMAEPAAAAPTLAASAGSRDQAQSYDKAKIKEAEELLNSGRLEEAYNIALSLATAGDPEAMAFIAGLALRQNAPLSREDAVRWEQRAADFGHAASQTSLAYYYLFGQYGYSKDWPTALNWARKSAAQGYTRAHQAILNIGSQSNLVSQSELAESASAIEAVAEFGDYYWMAKVGENYRIGAGVPRDLDIAAEWFLRVYENKDLPIYTKYEAVVGLGEVYTELGTSVENLERALDFFLIASSEQYCAEMVVTDALRMECTAVEAMRAAEARLDELKCAAAFNESVIRDPVVLFECDQPAAIALFAQERKLMMLVGEIGVRDGSLFVESQPTSDWRDTARARLRASNPDLTWSDDSGTSNESEPPLPFTCTMELSAAQDLQLGSTVEVRANLRNLDGTRPYFDCRL